MEVSTALLHHGRDGPSFPCRKEVIEVDAKGCDRPGGVSFWLTKLDARIRHDKVEIEEKKWSVLKAHLAVELAELEDVVPSTKIGEVFGYVVQMLRFWVSKSAGEGVEASVITDLYEWGVRLSHDLPEEEMINRIGISIRDTIVGKTEAWQAHPARMRQRSKGR